MKKMAKRGLSLLICLLMLMGAVLPAGALETLTEVNDLEVQEDIWDISFDPLDWDALQEAAPEGFQLEIPFMDTVGQGIREMAELAAVERAAGEYEMYPTPHSVTYQDATVTLPATMQVTYGEGIDQYTKARAVAAFEVAGVTLSESATTSVKLTVRIAANNEASTTSGLWSKTDAYKLTVDANGITVVGKDTDAAFYGLTTVKQILTQTTGKQVRRLVIEDWSDVAFRGFIEGYYGNPWSWEDRMELMKFGGDYKMNIYFYAPKDDPKHNAKWRELYTDEELASIRAAAQAGNESKCYFGYALHPFMNSQFNFNDFDNEMEVLKAKYLQVIRDADVRQIAILADDVYSNAPSGENLVRVAKALTEWVSSNEMQTAYPGLKVSIPLCPGNYGGNGTGNEVQTLAGKVSGKEGLPATVPIIMTGGKVWGEVSNEFLNTFYSNTDQGPFLWINWPCTDNSKKHLIMGGQKTFLHPGVSPEKIKGIMLNPMQQSEPSKVAIFLNAEYAWNIWQTDTKADQAWTDSFKYVDHGTYEETAASTALRELSKHMINQNMDSRVTALQESVELLPKLTAFRAKLEAGTVTAADCAEMKAEFQILYDAAVTYEQTGNERVAGQITYWLQCWKEFAQAAMNFLDAIGGTGGNVVDGFLSGQASLTKSQNHPFHYVDHNEYAEVGVQHLVPFVETLQNYASVRVEDVVGLIRPQTDPLSITGATLSDNWGSAGSQYGVIGNMTDGDPGTVFMLKASGGDSCPAGAYIEIDLGAEKAVSGVQVVGDSNRPGDSMSSAEVQYKSGDQWLVAATGLTGQFTAEFPTVFTQYLRIVNKTQISKWLRVGEIYVMPGSAPEIYEVGGAKVSNAASTVTDNSATVSGGVILAPQQCVGIKLPTIRKIIDIQASYTPAPGVVLEAGMNENEMHPVQLSGASQAQLLDADELYARYIRLRNTGENKVSFKLNSLSVECEPAPAGIQFVETNITDGTTGDTSAWFDGDIATTCKFNNTQSDGKYVLYDLGQTRSISRLDLVVLNSALDYPRAGKVQLSSSASGPWTDVVTFSTNASSDEDFNTAAKDAGTWQAMENVANYLVRTGTLQTPMDARYVRLYLTGSSERWVEVNEILINGGEYVPTENDLRFEVSHREGEGAYAPSKMADGNLTSGFRPVVPTGEQASITYHVTDDTHIASVTLIQDAGNLTNAAVTARVGEDQWVNLGTLDAGFVQLPVSESYDNVYDIKLTWTGAQGLEPTFYELGLVTRSGGGSGTGQTSSDIETVPLNHLAGSDTSILFNDNWKFYYGDASGAGALVYNDASWRTVQLPHDFSVELDFTSSGEAESGYLPGGTGWYRKSFTVDSAWNGKNVVLSFDGSYMDTEVYLNGTKLGENHYGYNPFAFDISSGLNYSGENVIAVKVSNPVPSSRWYSGSGLYRNVHVIVSEPVHVVNDGTYVTTTKGSGTDWTVNVKTSVQNSSNAAASVKVKQELFRMDPDTYKPTGSAVKTETTASATSVAAGATQEISQTFTVSNPALWNTWDLGEPNLYILKTSVLVGDVVKDTYETEFGFRTISADPNTGFKLNGVNLKLKGVCMHHDQGALGSEAWYRAMERQVEILRDMGCNSIRATHNPYSKEFIQICQRKGMTVIDELFDGWNRAKNGNSGDFSRYFSQNMTAGNNVLGGSTSMTWAKFVTETVLRRDRNSPAVIMWSICNEVQEGASFGNDFYQIATDLIGWIQALDNTRYVTRGDNTRTSTGTAGEGQFGISKAIADAGGYVGLNYYAGDYAAVQTAHNNQPTWLVYGSETASHTNSRGVYDRKNSNGDSGGDKLVTSYDKSAVGWGATASRAWWNTVRFDADAGEYVWTGFDYIGEPTPWNGTGAGWVSGSNSPKSSYFGIVDTAGLPKDNYYLYRAMWNEESTTLHVLPTWDEVDLVKDGSGRVEVVVYSNAPVVKLYLNGNEVGTATSTLNTTSAGHHYRTWASGTGAFSAGSNESSLFATFNVTYAAGTLEVKAFEANGTTPITNTVGRSVVKTTSGATKLAISADRSTIKNDGKDLTYVTVSVVDADGNIVNSAKNDISISVSGNGVFMGADNGVQPDHTSYLSSTRAAQGGQMVAIVQSTETAGTFTVTASAAGLAPASVVVTTSGAESSASQDTAVAYEIAKNYYVERGVAPELPSTVSVVMGNGSKVTKSVTWDEYDASQLQTVGNELAITGTIADLGLKVSVSVTVLDKVAALLNYSTAVQVGGTVNLPGSRPAVMADGTVLNAQFAVVWDEIPANATAKAGTVTVKGTADVFGETKRVTATIRVGEGSYVEGINMAPAAAWVRKSGESGAAVAGLNDSDTSTTWTGSGDVVFFYDTAQNLCKVKLTYSGTPSAAAVTISCSPNGADGTYKLCKPVDVTTSGSTVTYDLGKINSDVFFKLSFAGEVTLAEAELIVGTPVFPISSAATLDSIKVSGVAATAAQMAAKQMSVSSVLAVIEALSDNNVAITTLPENERGKVIIVTESEDHSARDMYTIALGAAGADAVDEYPYDRTTVSVASEEVREGSEGPKGLAIDNDPSTYWHTDWNADLSSNAASRYIQLNLDAAADLVGYRYQPRPTVANGIVTQYRIEVSTDPTGWTNPTVVASGTWAHDTTTKTVMFDETVTAQYIRLYGVETRGGNNDTPNKFMSAGEIRALVASGTDISPAVVTIDSDAFNWDGTAKEPTVTGVELFGTQLTEGAHYTVHYDHNTDPGTGYVYVEGTGAYSGRAWTTFTIKEVKNEIVSFTPVTVSILHGETATLPDTVTAQMKYGDDVEMDVVWDEFELPQSGTVIVYGTVEGYQNKPVAIINVTSALSVDGVSLVTPRGTLPTLPATVTVQFSDGTSGEYPVVWESKTTADFTVDVGTVVTVTGTVTGVAGVTAQAKVRVVTAPESFTNIALNSDTSANIFPLALSFWCSGDNNPQNAISGNTSVTSRWSDWESNTYHTNPKPWIAVVFEPSAAVTSRSASTSLSLNTKKVNAVKIDFADEGSGNDGQVGGHKVTWPQDYEVQYYVGPTTNLVFDTTLTDSAGATGNGHVRKWTTANGWSADSPLLNDANWQTVSYVGGKPPIIESNDPVESLMVVHFQTVDTAIVRVLCTPKSEQWVGMKNLEMWEEPVANHDFEVTSIKYGETAVTGWDGAAPDFSKDIELAAGTAAAPVVTAEVTKNASVSIKQATVLPGDAVVTITAEDGIAVQTYTIHFTVAGMGSGFAVTQQVSEHITVSAAAAVAPGTEVTLTPDAGYIIESILVYKTGEPATTVTVTDENGAKKFTMPDYPVTVVASAAADRSVIVLGENNSDMIVNLDLPDGVSEAAVILAAFKGTAMKKAATASIAAADSSVTFENFFSASAGYTEVKVFVVNTVKALVPMDFFSGAAYIP